MRRLYTDLLALRRTDPVLSALGTWDVTVDSSAPTSVLLLRYADGDHLLLLLINLGSLTRFAMNDPMVALERDRRWELMFCSERPKCGGSGVDEAFMEGCWLLQPHWLLRAAQ